MSDEPYSPIPAEALVSEGAAEPGKPLPEAELASVPVPASIALSQTASAPEAPPSPPDVSPSRSPEPLARPLKPQRPALSEPREPVVRETGGYRLRFEPADLMKLRELPGSKGKTDRELGEEFFDGQADRLRAALSEDVAAPAEVRVFVDPYSRQAFLAVGNKIRGIVSF